MCDWDSVSNYSTHLELFVSSCESSEWEDEEDDLFQDCFEMSGSGTEVVLGTTPKMGRRSMALADIDPKYVSQSGIWEASEVETSRGGSIRIQHLTAVSTGTRPLSTTSGSTFHGNHSSGATGSGMTGSRFPKLEECAHFHYDIVELPHLKFAFHEDQVQRCLSTFCAAAGSSEEPVTVGDDKDKHSNFSIEVVSGGGGQCWIFRRTLANWIKLDDQLHRCVWDRNFSRLEDLESTLKGHAFSVGESKEVIGRYLERLTILPTNQITCGTVLSWFEIDNRGRHIISSDDAALNTPAVAAALATKTYTAQAPDELSFRIGEMISVIDMPPPEESIWLRGKLTRESHEMGINFEVGFFPREYVEIIGEKVKFHTGVTPVQTTRRLARVSVTSTTSSPIPDKPVLRKHGKIISFFRSMMSRPEKRVLQQKGILRERVFNCDLAEHLLNTGSEIPIILRTCAQFIEVYGISDGIYRVSGSLRNTQRLRRLFDADEVPNLAEDEGIRQDVHAVSSVLKQYFRELPNPLCTYQLYEKFVHAISPPSNKERFDRIKEVIKELPPPHYRTLEYLMLHLSKMTVYSDHTGMTAQNMAIVWAPNLIRCRDLEGGNAAEFKGVSNHVIVTEFVIRYAERFFGKDKSPLPSSSEHSHLSGRPESLLLSSSSPMKLMSLEAAKEKLNNSRNYIEVGGGPSSLPPVYHTVIDTSKRRSGLKSKGNLGAGGGWKNFFSRNRSFSKGMRKTTASDIRVVMSTAMNLKDGTVPGFGNKLRPVRSEESLISSPYGTPLGGQTTRALENTLEVDESGDGDEIQHSTSSPASPVSDAYSLTFNHSHQTDLLPDASEPQQLPNVDNAKTHNRSISHDSYFESSMKRLGMISTEIHEEESDSKLSLEMSSIGEETPQKERSSAVYGDCDSTSSHATRDRSSFSVTPSTSTASLRPSYLPMLESSVSGEDSPAFHSVCLQVKGEARSIPNSPAVHPKAKPRLSKLRDCQVQTSLTQVNDVGVSTRDEETCAVACGIQFEPLSESSSSHSVRTASRRNIDLYQYPTFNELEKHEVSKEGLRFELDRNSSVDDSSTDTTPGVDPYSVTNIIYSPLLNDASSPTESSSSSEEPCSLGDACLQPTSAKLVNGQSSSTSPFFQRKTRDSGSEDKAQGDQSHYENMPTLMPTREHENILNEVSAPSCITPSQVILSYPNYQEIVVEMPADHEVKASQTFTDETQHYENLECLRQLHLQTVTADPPNVYEATVNEYIDENKEESTSSMELKNDPLVQESEREVEVTTSEGDFETVHENVNFLNQTQSNEPNPSTEKDYSETGNVECVDKEFHKVAELASPEGSSSITEDSAYADELVPDSENTENMTYLEIKDTNLVGTPEENSSPKSSVSSPVSEESGEHVNPFVVDNPLYGLHSVDIDTEAISKEVQKMSHLYNQGNTKDSESLVKENPVSRCNSAPLNETGREFTLSLVTDEEADSETKDSSLRSCDSEPPGGIDTKNRKVTRTTSMVREQQKLLLCKRLSEPSLNVPKNESEKGSWKYDAKRLTHRKQSVKELLTKFESTSQESVSLSPCPSPTRASPLNAINNNGINMNNGLSGSAGPAGLPKPTARSINSADTNACLRDRNNTRYQHHRFSMGDILMSQSMNSEGDKSNINQSSTMTRSDTFPELRNEASKENDSNSLDYSDKRTTIPEKMLHLFEVANTMVDNSDPNTRERIEKYKNNRRLFLREKYSGLPRSESESISSSSCKSSSSSGGGPPGETNRDSSSSIESVFSVTPGIDRSSAADSPRKRALSEDVCLHLSQNQFKAFKSEENGSSSSTLPLCYPDKKVLPRGPVTTTTPNINKKLAEVSKGTSGSSGKVEPPHPPLGYNSRLNIKSCPPGSLREAEIISVTTATVEVPTKCHWTSNPSIGGRQPVTTVESGKKIKDIAAFFEKKQF